MKYLLTGASGFLGSAINNALTNEEVYTLGRRNSTINGDLKNLPTGFVLPQVDIVVHMAGKAHIDPRSLSEEQDIYDTNVKGTQNLLNHLENGQLPKLFVFISSVAVYGLASGTKISEDAELLATDPYGRSKIEGETMLIEWANKHAVKYLILRLPLVAGMNPPGSLGAMINGIKKGFYFNIGGGHARKSIVMASDVALLVGNLTDTIQNGIYNLTDGNHPSFSELSIHLSRQLGKRQPLNLPYFAAKMLSLFGDVVGPKFPINSNKLKKITNDLTFDDSKARKDLSWSPRAVLESFKIS